MFGQLQLKSKVSPVAREMDGWLHSSMAWWIHSCLGHDTSTELLLCVKGLPRWLSGKESTCQYRRCRLDPWVGKSPWRKKWQTALVPLPEKSHGQKTGGLQSTGSQKLDTTEQLSMLILCVKHHTKYWKCDDLHGPCLSDHCPLRRHSCVIRQILCFHYIGPKSVSLSIFIFSNILRTGCVGCWVYEVEKGCFSLQYLPR